MFLVGNFFIIVSGDICSIDNNFEVSILSVGFAFIFSGVAVVLGSYFLS